MKLFMIFLQVRGLLGDILAPFLVPTAADGGQGVYRIWMQPYEDGSSGV